MIQTSKCITQLSYRRVKSVAERYISFRKYLRVLTAFPGSVARDARNAAMLSVVPVQTMQSSGNPGQAKRKIETFMLSVIDFFG